MRTFAMFAKGSVTFMSVWLISSVALSSGSTAPELPILAQSKTSAEYPVLRRVQDLTLDLQLLEITIKNRRDAATEAKISGAIQEIADQGAAIGEKFKNIRTSQLDGLYSIMSTARRYGRMMGVMETEWEELFGALKDGTVSAGMLTVHGRAGTMSLLSLAPLYIGKQLVWNVSLPLFDRKSFWVQARVRARSLGVKNNGSIGNAALDARLAELNTPFAEAERATKDYFTTSYAKLYSTFQTQRYAILQRVQMAKKALQELEKNNGAMGTPEEF